MKNVGEEEGKEGQAEHMLSNLESLLWQNTERKRGQEKRNRAGEKEREIREIGSESELKGREVR